MPIPNSRPSTGPTAATLWNWKAIVARKTNSTASMVQRLCKSSPRLCDRATLAGCRARTPIQWSAARRVTRRFADPEPVRTSWPTRAAYAKAAPKGGFGRVRYWH